MADNNDKDLIAVEVAFAKPEEQVIVTINVAKETSLEQAAKLSGLLVRFPEINGSELKLGVFGIVCKPEQSLRDGDRVEIYRQLSHDPKEARRQRANKPT